MKSTAIDFNDAKVVKVSITDLEYADDIAIINKIFRITNAFQEIQ